MGSAGSGLKMKDWDKELDESEDDELGRPAAQSESEDGNSSDQDD